MYMTSVVDKELYEYVKTLANEKFKSKTGIYRSSWIVREYKNVVENIQEVSLKLLVY